MKRKQKRIKLLIALLILIAVSLLLFFLNKKFTDDEIIGGDRDSHGCLGPAGFFWNASEQECVREWEVGDSRYQINNFQSCADAGYPTMESYPRQCRTLGGRLFVEELN
ncbi:MAG: hypothetical protein KJ905_03310 [Nanoarchaeota archaeon]|nr:hypothetical protein [Nanoarchaeota archaeon]MBU2458883.1 hypothetical protein [Nanoarchaeota archaeon]